MENRIEVVDARARYGQRRLSECSPGELVERVDRPGVPLVVMWTSAAGVPGCNNPGCPYGLFDPVTGMTRIYPEYAARNEYVRPLHATLTITSAPDDRAPEAPRAEGE